METRNAMIQITRDGNFLSSFLLQRNKKKPSDSRQWKGKKSYQKLFLKAPYVSCELSEGVPLGWLLTAANSQ